MIWFFIFCGALTSGLIAHSKGRNVLGWGLLGAVAPILSMIVAACMPAIGTRRPSELPR